MACNLSVALNTDKRSVAFRWFNLFREEYIVLHFVFKSLNGGLYQNGIKSFLFLFGNSWTSRAYHFTRPWSERFQNGRWLSVKKKIGRKLGFPIYRLFAHLGFFNQRGIYRDKKRGKCCRQLPFKVPMTRTFSCIFWLIVAFKVLNNQP